jgi:hypothetical protein
MKKVHDAEKELDEAKDGLDAVRKVRRKKAASNPKIIASFLIDLLEKRSVKRGPAWTTPHPKKSSFFLFFLIDVLENDQLKGSPYE